VVPDINGPDDVHGVAVLLHPHPDFGGSRFHPFIDGLFRRLPEAGIGAVRIDFTSADQQAARADVSAAVDAGTTRWPQSPLVLVGYSFGAGVAAGFSDDRISGWYLLAPPTDSLAHAVIGPDPRPKAIVVPEHDQFFPPDATTREVAGWASTTVTTAPNADHFLGNVDPIVEEAMACIGRLATTTAG
jgi:alpha/beta superfamily hydrolase